MADGEGHYSWDYQRLTNYLQSQQPRTGEFWSVDLHEAPHGWLGFAAHVLGPHWEMWDLGHDLTVGTSSSKDSKACSQAGWGPEVFTWKRRAVTHEAWLPHSPMLSESSPFSSHSSGLQTWRSSAQGGHSVTVTEQPYKEHGVTFTSLHWLKWWPRWWGRTGTLLLDGRSVRIQRLCLGISYGCT